jgi:hypothetical protein
MVARELPSDEVLASWQHVEQRALDLRAAGIPGTLQELRVRAYLDLLQERDSRDLPVGGQARVPDQPAPDGPSSGPSDPDPGPGGNGGPGDPGRGPGDPGGPGRNGQGGPGPHPGPAPAPAPVPVPAPDAGAGPSVAALVTLTIPLATWQGRSEAPGEADGFGLLDGDDARDLAAAAARHPGTRWCITALNPDGTAAAHGCLPGRHPPPGLAGPAPPGTGPPPPRPA